MQYRSINRIILLVLVLFAPSAARAADVLSEVPNDVLGFVVVHHLNAVDAKAKWLSLELRNNTFSPLAFLKTVTNVQDGVNLEGDFMLAVNSDSRGEKSRLRFGVWLPVTDYARFAKSIGASSVAGISTVTVAGEDLLVAHRGEWALVMDLDQRERMTQLVAASASAPVSPQISGWKKWIDSNDVTIIAYAAGVRELLSWVDDADGDGKSGDESPEDVFGAANPPARRRAIVAAGVKRGSSHGIAGVLDAYHIWTAASPEIAHTIEQANMVGCGLRINLDDKNGNSANVGLRVAFNDGFEIEPADAKAGLPNSLYGEGRFAFAFAGQLPKSVMETLAGGYLRKAVADLKKEEHTELDDESVQQLSEAVEQAAGEVQSVVAVTQPGEGSPPVYTNDFIAVRVASSADFVARIAEVVRLWNKANRDADGETKFILASEETKFGVRTARQYTLDFATMLGTPAVPEIRQSMEKLFGPGGKLRLWVVPTDNHTVLLAQALPEQVTAAVKLFDRKQPLEWNRGELSKSNRLLPAEANWRAFFDPHRYFDWERREALAVTGVPVIGGPLVKPFRDCPPIGIAGGFRDQELWMDAVALAPTLKNAYDFLMPAKPRAEVQLRIQRAPR